MTLVAPAPLGAQAGQSAISGLCQYPEAMARQHQETTLILCDTATISRDAVTATLDFSQRSWGSMARFTGEMAGNRVAVSQITLRNGTARAATGTCEIFHRDDGDLSAIRCLVQAASRWIAANFVPSRL